MMLKYFTSLGLLCLFFTASYAQLSSYDFSKYKLIDYEKHSLNFYFDLSGANNHISLYSDLPRKIEKTTSFSSEIMAQYAGTSNSRKNQKGYLIDFGINPFYEKKKTNMKMKSMFYTYLHLNMFRRNYYKVNKYFELSIESSNSFKKDRYRFEEDETNSIRFKNKSNVGFRHGHGRVEDITYGWHAQRILTELKLMGFGISELTHRDINDLGNILARQANKRYFDSRIKRIENLEELTTFFEQKGIESNTTFFTTLNDMYLYGVHQFRYQGNRFSYSVSVSDSYLHRKRDDEEIDFTSLTGGLNIRYKRFNAVKDWQFDYAMEVTFYGTKYKKVDIIYFLLPKFSFDIGFFPNTRTSFSSKMSILYDYNIDIGKLDVEKIVLGFENSVYYYLSSQVRLNAALNFNTKGFVSQNLLYSNRKSFSYKIGVNYFLF